MLFGLTVSLSPKALPLRAGRLGGGGGIAIRSEASCCFSFSLAKKRAVGSGLKNAEELEGRALKVARSRSGTKQTLRLF